VAVAGKNKKPASDTPQEPEATVQPRESFFYPLYDMPRIENGLLWHGIDSAWVPGVALADADNTKPNPFENAISL
jgi:hypothetical protein